jgi:hypothetical protein
MATTRSTVVWTSTNITSAGTSDVNAGDTIAASHFRSMLDVLTQLTAHNHVFYDDYTTVCDCQCDCDCSRGTL